MFQNGGRVLVTGAVGFIGFHVCMRLLSAGAMVLGVDNFSSYYDVSLKEERARLLLEQPGFALNRSSIEDVDAFADAWHRFQPEIVIHLAGQAGVRHSIDAPASYVGANIVGTFNVLELARHNPVRHLLIASTSSVYGSNPHMPFTELERIQAPLSLYAATKGATELMGHSYSHLFEIPVTFFRFFTVYGPWGRPDMALFKFARAILEGRAIDVYNNGNMVRDFTFIDDLVEAITLLINAVPSEGGRVEGDSLSLVAPFRVVNIGAGASTKLMDYIAALESALNITAIKNFLPMQAGDVPATEASADLLHRLTKYRPSTTPAQGVPRFMTWFRDYYKI